MIENVSGKRYSDFLQERILNPLAMKDSGLDNDQLVLSQRAQGYQQSGGILKRARSESMTVPWAAGSMYATTHDLMRWEHGMFSNKLFSERSLKAMTTAGKGNYGLGGCYP